MAVKLDGLATSLQWKRSTCLLVQGRGFKGYLTDTKRKPATSEQDVAQWRIENSVVLMFLLNTMIQSVTKSVQLLETAHELYQGNLFVMEYATKLKRLWSEKHLEEERVQDFLCGLNPEFESVRVQLLAKDTSPSLGQVFSTILSEEIRQRGTFESSSSIRSALTVQPQQLGEKACFHCKKSGHTKAFY
ncbi:uncharacterized protein [Elaeis guineensis]|uniref:uncharacterized protein n=1 Tax=Elaeis guineensis var. tenera TaxID=51953 RepID=UPI003C6CC6E1